MTLELQRLRAIGYEITEIRGRIFYKWCGTGTPPTEAVGLLHRLKEQRRQQTQIVHTDTGTRIIYRPGRAHLLPPVDVTDRWRRRYRRIEG